MANKISFSEKTKDEIINYQWTDKQINILLYSFIRTNGKIEGDKLILKTTLKRHLPIFEKWFENTYDVTVKVKESKTLVHIIVEDKDFINKFTSQLGNIELEDIKNIGAYTAGAFVGKGWISNSDSKFYHFEIRIKTIDHSLDLIEAFDAVGIKTITLFKDGWYYTYIKKSLLIADALKLMNATSSLLEFEDQRIQRDFISNMTKLDSIEPYNQFKISVASQRQIKAIEKIFKTNKVLLFTEEQKQLFELRVSNPHLSLNDLSIVYLEKYQKQLSKSTVNNWLAKTEELSK